MNAPSRGLATLAMGLAAAWGALAQAPAAVQPPMNDFYQAFYQCEGGEAFMMSYDSETPEKAEMIPNSDRRKYDLARTAAPSGVAFVGAGARFWTDGKTVVAEAGKASFHNCRIKKS